MIALFTDYGHDGPYLGQVLARLHELAPREAVVSLMSDAPGRNPKAAAYLLPAVAASLPKDSIVFSVVDPRVGMEIDPPSVIRTGDYCFVGPDNGLFDLVIRRSARCDCRRIRWRPESLSATFHGRDLYAPVCARLALGDGTGLEPVPWTDTRRWPDDLWEIVYVDRFGNVMLGVRAGVLSDGAVLRTGRHEIPHAATFGRVANGVAFWYGNSSGLAEIAVNGGSAAERLGLRIGDVVRT